MTDDVDYYLLLQTTTSLLSSSMSMMMTTTTTTLMMKMINKFSIGRLRNEEADIGLVIGCKHYQIH